VGSTDTFESANIETAFPWSEAGTLFALGNPGESQVQRSFVFTP
jgi:hypothetical protein